MKQSFKRIISFLLMVGILIGGSFSMAPTPAIAATETLVKDANGNVVNAQAATYRGDIEAGKGSATSNSAANTAGGAVACAAGQILGNLLTSSISSALTGQVTQKATGAVEQLVPVDPKGQHLVNSNLQTNAQTGTAVFGVLVSPSWDSIAWCLINSIIEYLIDATIEWAKTGFNGNPAFVDNPEQFFQSIADQEAGAFIQQIASGAGIDVCQPFRAQIAIGLATAYGVNEGKKLNCSLSTIANNATNAAGFTDGEFNYSDFFTVSQYQQNNFRGNYILGNEELGARVVAKNNTAQLELGWGSGFLNFKHCEETGNVSNPKTCITDTPGTIVQSSLEKSLGIPKDRLVIAQKFDQLVTVLINSLIKVALDEVLASDSDD
ncbi:MAG: hypothetical protein V4664_01805 [Patescibacteria group bacterium]